MRVIRAVFLAAALLFGVAASQSVPGGQQGPSSFYVVQPGDTLFHISQIYGTDVPSLMSSNNLESTTVEVGQMLAIPGAKKLATVAAKPSNARAPSGPSTWKLQPPAPTLFGFGDGQQALVRTTGTGKALPPVAYLGGLSFALQTYNNCGPAAVSSVLGYYGIRASQEQLRLALRPQGGYMSASVIDPYLHQFGLRATIFRNGNVGAVKRLVSQGIPVIVLQWLDRPGHVPHFRVVRGYDDQTGLVWVTDSMIGEAAYVSYKDFDTLWNTQGRLMIPVYPTAYAAQVMKWAGAS